MSARRPRRARLLLAAGAAALTVPALAAAQGPATAPSLTGPDPEAARAAALDAASAWAGSLEAFRAPQLPTPGDTESVILMLDGPAAVAADPGDRAAAAAAIAADQAELTPVLESLGATVTFRYRVLVNAVAVRLPAGRLEALAALPEVTAVVPVGFLAPAQAGGSPPQPSAAPGGGAPPDTAASPAGPAHIALIDGGVDASHPWLGGGIGPTFPIIGGADLVGGDDDPSPDPADPAADAHGTQMASLVLRSAALEGLPAADVPRLLSYRVLAREAVGGRLRPLARTDRVLAALERAVDPDRNGDPSDTAEVILIGLAAGFQGAGVDPVAQAAEAADRAGATVVVPSGNDGPSFTRPGTVGSLAAGETVIAVGGVSAAQAPRTAHVDARLGPAAARLGPLPLMGAETVATGLPVVVLRDEAGISQGGAPEDFLGPDGSSRVAGALVVVARGQAPLAETAARAADAGAAALALWDEDGAASFPAIPGTSGIAIPVVGLGAGQGAALVRLAATAP
ncbi:MAG: S8 family serine peptidase, partial [Thermoleophilia bacterium]